MTLVSESHRFVIFYSFVAINDVALKYAINIFLSYLVLDPLTMNILLHMNFSMLLSDFFSEVFFLW